MRAVGVLGGMGPAATLDFLARVRRLTPARRDQDHLRLIVDDNPTLPDRNLAIAGQGRSPGPEMAAMARGLERAGAQVLVMPCNTAHAFEAEVRRATDLPFLSIIEATVQAALASGGVRRAGVLATTGCVASRLYQRALSARGVEALTTEGEAMDRFMAAVYAFKAGDRAPAEEVWPALARDLVEAGAEILIAGCTEVPLVLTSAPVPLIDSTEELAKATVRFARG